MGTFSASSEGLDRNGEPKNEQWLSEVSRPSSATVTFPESAPLKLESGQLLAPLSIAYQTYGTLNAAKSNAILICHALTGDQHVANAHPITGKPGWWEVLVGPGKPIDTD